MVSWTCVFGLMFFSLELSLSRLTSQSHSRSWSVTGAHVHGRLKGKIKHLMSEMNSQPQQLCFRTYHLTCSDRTSSRLKVMLTISSGATQGRFRQVQLFHARSFSSFARLSFPVLGSMPCVRLAKLSFAERVGRNTVHTFPAILIVAHCSLCRAPHARANALHRWIACRSRHLFRVPL